MHIKKNLFIFFIVSIILAHDLHRLTAETDGIIEFSPDQGADLLLTSGYRCDYWHLTKYFETQYTNTYCGVASSIMVLNALKSEKPKVERLACQLLFTQEEYFFSDAVTKIITEEDVRKRGIRFEELANALRTFDLEVSPYYGTDLDPVQFREMLKTVLRSDRHFLIANYHRGELGQNGGGHYSPIAAYNEEADCVLILDVSRYKYPPIWVKIDLLIKSMQAIEQERNLSRGVLLITYVNAK